MQRFECKCILILGTGERTTRILNEYARDGWQLVAVSWSWHYFQRELLDSREVSALYNGIEEGGIQ